MKLLRSSLRWVLLNGRRHARHCGVSDGKTTGSPERLASIQFANKAGVRTTWRVFGTQMRTLMSACYAALVP